MARSGWNGICLLGRRIFSLSAREDRRSEPAALPPPSLPRPLGSLSTVGGSSGHNADINIKLEETDCDEILCKVLCRLFRSYKYKRQELAGLWLLFSLSFYKYIFKMLFKESLKWVHLQSFVFSY